MIEILKASAGSGKTYTLAKKYIGLLLEKYKDDSHAYRHILAVTFTNKATDEMKSRILRELYCLAKSTAKSPYYNDFVPRYFSDEQSLAEAAEIILCNILHDYSSFSISTIDRFFQRTLKAFAREIGQFASYQLELDRKSLVNETVDRVLDSLSTEAKDAERLKWLSDHAISQLQDGKSYKLESSLYSYAERLMCEERRQVMEDKGLSNSVLTKEFLENLDKLCAAIIKQKCDEIQERATQLKNCCENMKINQDDTNRKFLAGILERYTNFKGNEIKGLSETEDSYLNGDKPWFPKKNAFMEGKVNEVVLAAAADLQASLSQDAMKLFYTAKTLREQVYSLGLASDLSREFEVLLKEKNVLGIDDSNSILRDIIDGTDTPFIYEKLGVRYDNFLLDEFQDTSKVQWDNFKPLLENSLSSGHYNLVVGDVKQSIYRWRGSDWELLGKKLPEELSGVKESLLDHNFRSKREIVEFNNGFFSVAASDLQDKFDESTGNQINDIYADVEQELGRKNDDNGFVKLTFVDKDAELDSVLESVLEAQSRGYRLSDITVLVRGNKEGALVASKLISSGISVVTDDSLTIKSSVIVRRLLSLLELIDNPNDNLAGYMTENLNVEVPEEYHSLFELCESLLRQLRDADEKNYKAESLYIQSFMDKVQDFGNMEASGLHAFLENMKDDNSCISSPSVGNSVRVMTIHKSKGLDFPYVIIPFLEKIKFFRHGNKWCSHEHVEQLPDGVYDVVLSGGSDKTYFSEAYKEEKLKQYVDNLNVAYVAFTRASSAMHIIAAKPSKSISNGSEASDFASLLYYYAQTHSCFKWSEDESFCVRGDDKQKFVHKEVKSDYASLELSYPSFPLGERLAFSCDSSDFFSADEEAGLMISNRRRGIVMHDILSMVNNISDLDPAIEFAVNSGRLSADDAPSVRELLHSRIQDINDRFGWFDLPSSDIWNEVSLISEDGSYLRPDRVMHREDGSIEIVDYKFGQPKASYRRQIALYASIYRSMHYENVKTYLWYVDRNELTETENLLNL